MADPELDVEPEEFDDLPAFANDENKQLHAQVREREKALATIDAELEDTKERISVMEGHLGSVKTEQLHTQRLVDAKVKEIETEDHLKQLAERERGRFHAEFNKLTVEIAELQDLFSGAREWLSACRGVVCSEGCVGVGDGAVGRRGCELQTWRAKFTAVGRALLRLGAAPDVPPGHRPRGPGAG